MTIPVEYEGDDYCRFEAENCCFCHQPTRHWTEIPERLPGEQVACCEPCADTFDVDVVPTKDEWWDWNSNKPGVRS